MWMQILAAAGLPVIGDRHPERFRHLHEANPAGFYESRLRQGVYHATNPDPKTGIYLHPDHTRTHALKVFVPGLVRTDHAFLHRVVATVRPWREYVASVVRLQEMEGARARGPASGARVAERANRMAPPPELEWWQEMYALVRDVTTRRYPVHLVTYDHLLEHAEDEVREVLGWIGEGDVDPAVAAVRSNLRTQRGTDVGPGRLDAEAIGVFDDLYDAIRTTRRLDPPLLRRMNELNRRLAPRDAASGAGSDGTGR